MVFRRYLDSSKLHPEIFKKKLIVNNSQGILRLARNFVSRCTVHSLLVYPRDLWDWCSWPSVLNWPALSGPRIPHIVFGGKWYLFFCGIFTPTPQNRKDPPTLATIAPPPPPTHSRKLQEIAKYHSGSWSQIGVSPNKKRKRRRPWPRSLAKDWLHIWSWSSEIFLPRRREEWWLWPRFPRERFATPRTWSSESMRTKILPASPLPTWFS